MKTKTSRILVGICVVGLIISLWYAISVTINQKEIPNTKQNIIDDCKNLSLVRTARCLQQNIKTFYKYGWSAYEPTFQELKIDGGTCMDWSNLYKELGFELGYYSETIEINMTQTNGHMVAMISNNQGYCILDGENKPFCNDNFNVPNITMEQRREDLREYVDGRIMN